MMKRARVTLSASTGSHFIMSGSEKRLRSAKTAEAPAATRTRRRGISACMNASSRRRGRSLGCPHLPPHKTEKGSVQHTAASATERERTAKARIFSVLSTLSYQKSRLCRENRHARLQRPGGKRPQDNSCYGVGVPPSRNTNPCNLLQLNELALENACYEP